MSGSSERARSGASFIHLPVRVADAALAERVAAEAFEAGALGLEERDEADGITLLLYAAPERAQALREAIAAGCGAAAAIGPEQLVDRVDWSEAWKEGLEPVVVSPRLAVRPPFREPVPGVAAEVVIDPGQAFGTGGHASTRLALDWLDALAPVLPGARVLDVGCGSGVLALAALRLGAERAVGLDLDPLTPPAARANAVANRLEARLDVFTGPLAALAAAPFDVVLANLLSRELLPLASALAACTAERGAAVISGLLAEEQDRVAAALAAAGLRCVARRSFRDATGETWTALLTRP